MAYKDLIYLVNAGNDQGMSGIVNDCSFPPLGVLALGTWLKKRVPDLEVIVRDGGVHSQSEVIKDIYKYKPGLVGVSVLSTSYQNCLEIARGAKDCGSKVVFGNDQAAHLAKKILNKRPEVDYVIGSEYGEKSLEMLARNLMYGDFELGEIPHIAFREGKRIRGFDYERDKQDLSIAKSSMNPAGKRVGALDVFPVVDRSLFPKSHWKSYLNNYLDKFLGLHKSLVTGVTTMNRARGCSRQGEDICKHCDMLLDISFSSPEIFWKEVRTAHEQVGANVFYEVCDSFSSFEGFIDKVGRAKPSNLGFEPNFFVYVQARDLVRKKGLIQKLKEIGVFRVNIGLESGSDQTLRHMKGPGDSVEQNYKALKLLRKGEIYVYGSLVLGTSAETSKTLRETINWSKKIINEGLIADIEAQPILPLPNNYQGRSLIKARYIRDNDSDLSWHTSNTDKLSETYINNFSKVSFKRVVDACIQIKEFAEKNRIRWGSGVLKKEAYKNR